MIDGGAPDDPVRWWADVPVLDLLPRRQVRQLSVVHPTQAPGFWEFRALGCGPVVPTEPPPVGPRSTLPWIRLTLAWGGAIALYLCCLFLELSWAGWLLLAVAVLVAGYLTLATQVGSIGAVLDAAERGYTLRSSYVAQGGAGSRRHNGAATRLALDLRGLWHLRRDGTVITPPDRRVLAPGFYPSPATPMTLEAWSGAMWIEGTPVPVAPDHPAHDALAKAWARPT